MTKDDPTQPCPSPGSAGEHRILEAFLRRQWQDGAELAAASDLLELQPLGGSPPDRYVARYRCKGLVLSAAGEVREADDFRVGIWFPSDYLRRAEPTEVLTWLGPANVFHPNIGRGLPFLCIGRLLPGMPLVDLLYRCFELITYQKVTMREDDALNADACVWARQHGGRLPIDGRPLKRRRLELAIRVTATGRRR